MKIWSRICQALKRTPPTLPPGATAAERGVFGENRAAEYYRRQVGAHILHRNWRYGRGEIDLICKDGSTLVFVEVRARSFRSKVAGVHSVTPKKKKVLLKTCIGFIKQLPKRPKHIRFDILDIVLLENGEGEVRHYANVPLFPKHYLT